MANEKEVFGLPKVLINFRTQATTAIARSARGIVVMILKNESTNTSKHFRINDLTDIPATGLLDSNIDLIKKTLLGTPLRVLLYTLPLDSVTVTAGGGAAMAEEDADSEGATPSSSPASTVETETKLTQADILKQIVNIKWNYICNPTGSTQDQEDLAS